MPAPNPERPEEFTEDQWEKACAAAKRRYRPETWENPPYAGIENPEGWRFSQCYMSALNLFPLQPVEVTFDVKQSELEPRDIFTGDEFKQGDRVIRIGGKNNWIYNRDELEKWWKQKPKTNPLVGTDEMAEGTTIEYGTLNIVPDEGGRRKTRKHKRRTRVSRTLRVRKTRRRHK